MRSWPALDVVFDRSGLGRAEAAERLAVAIDDLGATAVQESEDSWRVFFAGPDDRDAGGRALASLLGSSVAVAPVDVADEDWARRSQEDLGPVRVGRLVVAPPWSPLEGAREAGLLLVTILPSMGFGTGHHQTTRLCLALLQDRGPCGLRVFDVGTGSGVLALAAWRLGASAVLAVDDDRDALGAAAENLELNGAGGAIQLRHGDFRVMRGLSADLVLANLTGALLLREAGTLAGAVAPGGSLIASGLTLEEESRVAATFGLMLSPAGRVAEGEWVGLRFDRRPAGPADR